MPSFLHQVIVERFRNRETLAAELLEQVLRVRLPRYSRAQLRETGLSELVPTDYWADLVVMLESDRGGPVYGVVVEVQLGTDRDKRWVWPLYAAALRAKHRCPCCVLVVAPWPSVARWAAKPVETGQPDSSFKPLVLGCG